MGAEGTQRRERLLWLALAMALSPVLADLGSHLAKTPWTRYVLVFPLLTARAIPRCPARVRPQRDGFALLLLALGLELLTLGGGLTSLARVAIPLAAFGLARALGRPLLAVATLTTWWLPVPNTFVALTSPGLESALVVAAAALWKALGVTLRLEGSRVVGMHGMLALEAADGGLPLAAVLSGLGWYAATLRGRALGSRLRTAGAWAVLALPVQVFAIFVAIGAAGLSAASAARLGLTYEWVGVAVLGWITAERGAVVRSGEVGM